LKRRTFAAAAVFAVSAFADSAAAQRSGAVPVIGFLTLAGADSFAQFREAMRELGYVEGAGVIFQRRSSGGRLEPLPGLAAELVRMGVDVLYATGPAAVRAAFHATRTIAIVAFDLETDPVASGLVDSLSRPGGNLTGLFLDLPDLAGKWLDLFHEVVPDRKSVRVLWDSTTGTAQLAALRSAAQRLDIRLAVVEIRNVADLDAALAQPIDGRSEGLIVLSSPLASGNSRRIAEFTLHGRVPAISAFRAFAEAGGLLSYGPNLLAFRRFAAAYVDKILRGAKPAELPIQQPDTFEFVVNVKTASRFGVTIPGSVLVRADQVLR
jgi:putative ABC transport system substrate-binding protein